LNTSERNAPALIEKHTIGYVPPEDRHGKVRDLFTLWFGGNIAPLPIVTGALGVQIFHLNLLWGIVAIVVGQAVGGVLMALHSAQGPQMGIPQMTWASSRPISCSPGSLFMASKMASRFLSAL
jgi:NCS1 family nucleobase:cation symporter-1